MRGLRGVTDADARHRLEPMNCLAWNVGHLAWQEQEYFLWIAQERMLYPEIRRDFAYGAPASAPPLKEVMAAWKAITADADPWLDGLTSAMLADRFERHGEPFDRQRGSRLQRVIYHYWFHTGENAAIRQALGHRRLPQFVGSIDTDAPYVPEAAES